MSNAKGFLAFGTVLATVSVSASSTNPFKSDIYNGELNSIEFSTRNPELDVIVSNKAGGTGQFCMSPETDAVPTSSQSLALGYQGSSVGENSGAGAATLGGVSTSVLITREILYRTCEFIMNNDLTKAEAIELYGNALAQVMQIADTDANAGTTAAVEAEAITAAN
ncbi:MAG: hypothetical protein ABNH53_00965 [Henriciella sp.]|jgi:hypothetical protein